MEKRKESGMGKLIELLNEYETPRSGVVYKSYDDYDGFFYGVDCDGETEIAWSDSLICSAKDKVNFKFKHGTDKVEVYIGESLNYIINRNLYFKLIGDE